MVIEVSTGIEVSTVIVSGPAAHARAVPAAVQAAGIDEVQETFLELVYADEELLRAEFDAIIAEEWGQPTPPARRRPTRPPAPPPQRRERHHGSAGGSTGRPGRQHHPTGEGRSRQRAPPAAASKPAIHPTS
jgi:hypothetical protein